MLALTRKKGESLVINNDIEITILEIRGDQITGSQGAVWIA